MDVKYLPENGAVNTLRLVDSPEKRQQVLGEVFAGVAHDLANVFTYVLANAEFLTHRLRNYPEQVVITQLDVLRRGADDACKILKGLLSFSAGQKMPANYLINLASVAEEVLAWAKSRSEANGSASRVDFKLDYLSSRPPLIWGNLLSMKRLLINLVLNAIEAMPEGGRLTIGLKSLKDRICLSVTDTGRGMGSDTIHRLFEPYFTTQERNGPSRRQGIGLGLCNVRQIVAEHRGEMTVESVPGMGTTFNISLPAFFAEEGVLHGPQNGEKSIA